VGTLHPALVSRRRFHHEDRGNGTGENGQWGWGSEIIPLFDPAKIHVYNEAHADAAPLYIEEGLWTRSSTAWQTRDFILLQFGHNDPPTHRTIPTAPHNRNRR